MENFIFCAVSVTLFENLIYYNIYCYTVEIMVSNAGQRITALKI